MAAGKRIDEKLRDLEEIADTMENGDLSIEDMVKEYAKGVKLADSLKKSLESIELKIEEIS